MPSPPTAASPDARDAGALPPWATVSPARYQHCARVAAVMNAWAAALGLPESERRRWRTVAWMHDALRDADPASLRTVIEDPVLRTLPSALLHGPAAADRMARDGFDDGEALDAIRYHTIGCADLGRLGCALIAADFLEPGRTEEPAWRAQLRARLPASFDDVMRDVLAAKLVLSIQRDRPLLPGIVALWNRFAGHARPH